MKDFEPYSKDAIELLKSLIKTPSFSREESKTGDLIEDLFNKKGVQIQRIGNNVIALPKVFNPSLPCIWLNSHHDTVKPNSGYTLDPFDPIVKDGKLFGLGSNDAGGALVCLIQTFFYFYKKDLPVNLILVASAEEEISGAGGISLVIEKLPKCDLAIVGEPTLNKAAVAEKGLMVIESTVGGKSGHAARDEGINAINEALEDLITLKDFKFKRVSPLLGESKATTTIIQSGSQHNVVPDTCTYTIDVRVTDAYSLEEALDELRKILKAELKPRSIRLQPSKLPERHLMQKVLDDLTIEKYGSPTLSDQALIPYPSVKMGPGDSARSHTSDEYIFLEELEEGIKNYVRVLETYIDLLRNTQS
ncbi:M20/M25/M40 family metallo-hydrolase [Algoriphagus sediminis]|uniref:M20/M25/M40 family metallo-hydrolase n=1 Tax=Algoriphagus sediminis TaxID=3057113 RepID=A0ABT7YDC2_9BACT|nr:M20/M25/M40 family metallo-hydrolase [Algoriphagus sediminis]MDN3204478.1 M20/M25/M40 family metallo-hydrolase [Algoriphagus sediminis]